jgi:hypothetical protein
MANVQVPERPVALLDIRQQQRTYHEVLIGSRYVVLATVVLVSFLVLAFCTQASYLTAFVVALVELALGLVLAKDRKAPTVLSDVSNLFISTSADSGHE